MQLRFENRLEDMLAFNRYHASSSAAMRRAQRRPLLLVAVGWFACVCFLARAVRSIVPLLVGMVFIAAALVLLAFLTRWRMRRLTRQLYAEGSNKGLYGWHELELSGDQLTKRSLYLTTIMDLRLIERIAETPQYAFIYYSAVNAIVLPRRDVTDAEYHDFIDELRDRLGAVLAALRPVAEERNA
jgi:hypothetical protein